MVDIDRIEEEDMTAEEVLDRYTAQPRDTVEWIPEWDDHPEERPGENTRIEDETLIWENGEFEIRLESYETTHWKAVVSVPEDVGELYPRDIDLKCHPLPEHGYVESVEIDDYVATAVTLILAENFMPIHEVNTFVDDLRDDAAESQQFMDNLEAGLEAASDGE